MHYPIRVLLGIDGPVLADLVQLALHHGVYVTRTIKDVEEVGSAIRIWQPHLAIIDMDMAEGKVLDMLGYTAPTATRLPVIVLTRRGDLKAKLEAFDHGVDDILTLPFSPEELVARTLVIVRRTYQAATPFIPVIQVGEIEIDILNRRVQVKGEALQLTSLEQDLLYLLAANVGRVLTRDEILDHLWGVDYIVESNVVDRHIRNLRVKLQNHHRRPRYIATVPGQGYRFVPAPTSADELSSPT